MQKISLTLNIILLLAVGFLMAQHFKTNETNLSEEPDAISLNEGRSGKIAFINIDSLDAKYQFILDSVKEIKKEEKRSSRELELNIKAAEAKSLKYQQEAAYMTQAKYEAAQLDMESEARKIQELEASLTDKMRAKRLKAEKTYQDNLYSYLEEFNRDEKYDFILAMSGISSILWAKDTLDITQPILEHLNGEYLDSLVSKEDGNK